VLAVQQALLLQTGATAQRVERRPLEAICPLQAVEAPVLEPTPQPQEEQVVWVLEVL
jgi:hypothetical protein